MKLLSVLAIMAISGAGAFFALSPKPDKTAGEANSTAGEKFSLPVSSPNAGTTVNITDNLIKESAEVIEQEAEKLEIIHAPAPVQAAEKKTKPTIAVLAFDVKGNEFLSADTGEMIAEVLVSEIDSDKFNITERGRLRELMAEMDFSNMAAASTSDVAKLGISAKADFILTGTLGRLGGKYFLSGRLINSSSRAAAIAQRCWVDFDSLSELQDKIPELVNLLSLRSGSTSINEPIKTEKLSDLASSVNPEQDFGISLKTSSGKYRFAQGEYISFALKAEKDCYITLLTVDPTGEQTLLLPNKWRKNTFVRRGEQITIPQPDWGFRMPIQPPHGRTIVKAIATAKPIRIEGISEAALDASGFASAGKTGLKAIGIESAKVPQNAKAMPLERIFSSGEWASCEIEVFTFDPADQKAAPNNQSTIAKPIAFNIDADMKNASASEKLLLKYNELTRDLLEVYTPLAAPEKIDGIETEKNDSVVVFSGNKMSVIKLDETDNASKLIKMLKAANPAAIAVENIRLESFANPVMEQTHLLPIQWALKNNFGKIDTSFFRLSGKYDLSRITPAPVAVIDSAIDFDDTRLAQCAAVNIGELEINGRDDDSNGFVDDIIGYNFLLSSGEKLCTETEKFNHGSFIASIIAAKPVGADMDILGLSPNTKIIPVVCLDSKSGSGGVNSAGKLDKLLQALEYAMNRGVKIINLSLGARVSADRLAELEKLPIWDELESRDVLIICAAGNSNADIDAEKVFPACINRPNIISVMAIDPDGHIGCSLDPSGSFKPYSNYGQNSVDIAAPGSFILGITGRNRAGLRSGTSFSAAYVSAAASLVRGKFPHLSAAETRQKIIDCAAKLDSLKGKCLSGAALDMTKLLD